MKRILVVVDYQNDFVNGSLSFSEAERIDSGIANKIRSYGKNNVFYTMDTHTDIYLGTREGKCLPVLHCQFNTKGWEVYGETAKALNEVNAFCIEKIAFGISPSYMKPFYFKSPWDIKEVEIVGLVTNMSVISNAVIFQSYVPNALITVDASLCSSFNKDLHEKALDVIESMQINVINR